MHCSLDSARIEKEVEAGESSAMFERTRRNDTREAREAREQLS